MILYILFALLISCVPPILAYGILVEPIKMGIKKKVGADKYNHIINEYKKTWDRTAGIIVIGLAIILVFAIARPFVQTSELIWAQPLTIVINVAFVISVIAVYFFLKGLVKAMANMLKPSNS